LALRRKDSPEEPSFLCPSCSAILLVGAKECPECGEVLTAGDLGERPSGGAAGVGTLLFWAGLGLMALGGPGLALGSWLHDVLRIPIGGNQYDVFGPLNRFTAAVGLVVLVVGIVLVLLSIRLAKPVLDDDYDVGTPKRA